MKVKFIILFCLIALVSTGYGQKIKLESGSLSPLKGQKSVSIQYSYEGLLVGKMSESDYIKKKVTDYNADEPGRGDTWKEAWKNDRKTRFQPKFEELFNKYLEEVGMTAKESASDAIYTIVVKTTMIEPGWNVGVMRSPAFINVDIDVVETSNPSNVVSSVSVLKSPGADVMGYDFDCGVRISEAYAKLGKAFAKFIIKNAK
jgi:hypothetical protein